MNPIFLLDTNILSEPLKPSPNATVLDYLHRHSREIATATVVWHELGFGAERLPPGRRRDTVKRYLHEVAAAHLLILPHDQEAATWHARERAWLVAAGQTPAFADGQIAAIAAVNSLTLVTRNLRDFQPFRGFRVTNWFP